MSGNDMAAGDIDANQNGSGYSGDSGSSTHATSKSLIESIASVTRPAHTKLNKLIVARLPLALPPHSSNPSLYASGLLHVAPIYITFEALWQNILDTPPSSAPVATVTAPATSDQDNLNLENDNDPRPRNEDPQPQLGVSGDRVRHMLQRLHLPGLLRTARLKTDIKAITGWPDHVVEDQLKKVGQEGRLAELLSHMKRSVENRPHILLSYSYIFFMALFAGGRFVRATLESAGEDFWNQVPSPIKPTMHPCERGRPARHDLHEDGAHRSHAFGSMPLRFFHFPTPSDGEDLKLEFKKRLSEMEATLTARETHDIVQEAVCIFENMTLLIHQLDNVCGELEQRNTSTPSLMQRLSLPRNFLPSRLRDSVAVAKERRSADTSRQSSSSEDNVCSRDDRSQDEEKATQTKLGELIRLCPAMSNKAVRFEEPAHSHPRAKSPHGSRREQFVSGLTPASKTLRMARLSNWLVVVAFGFIIFGALVSVRRP